jgi:ATP-binding protein involved in chromosome partitioning
MNKAMRKNLHKKIKTKLDTLIDPAMGRISNISINGKDVTFVIEVDPARGKALEPMRFTAEQQIAKMRGVKKATAILTAEITPQTTPADPHGNHKNPKLAPPIKHIIAVASGKGGVGKSTIALNIAAALAKSGVKTGLLDADIYGPSQPRMTKLEGQKPAHIDGKIQPLSAHGINVMSIGFMLDNKEALIWRGPMVQSALYQMIRDVHWGTYDEPLDVLIIDMPPGTGDAQLTVVQKIPLSGALIVSTPQDIALLDARKGIEMFQKTNVPILGLIENMAVHTCTNCGHEEHIFGHDGVRREAEALGVPFLGALPLSMDIRVHGDKGQPYAHEIFKMIAAHIKDTLAAKTS